MSGSKFVAQRRPRALQSLLPRRNTRITSDDKDRGAQYLLPKYRGIHAGNHLLWIKKAKRMIFVPTDIE